MIAVPLLLMLIKDQSPLVVLRAADALGRLHQQPDIVVPELVRLLRYPPGMRDEYKRNLLYDLERFGENARAAVPEILKVIHHPDAQMGRAATNALKAIDPETAAKMGIK
jgi:HEAT repeat protein